jgi:hypothetical protein
MRQVLGWIGAILIFVVLLLVMQWSLGVASDVLGVAMDATRPQPTQQTIKPTKKNEPKRKN